MHRIAVSFAVNVVSFSKKSPRQTDYAVFIRGKMYPYFSVATIKKNCLQSNKKLGKNYCYDPKARGAMFPVENHKTVLYDL